MSESILLLEGTLRTLSIFLAAAVPTALAAASFSTDAARPGPSPSPSRCSTATRARAGRPECPLKEEDGVGHVAHLLRDGPLVAELLFLGQKVVSVISVLGKGTFGLSTLPLSSLPFL